VVQVTEPVGVLAVPRSLSLTVAVQVVLSATPTGLGVHATVVVVARVVTVSVPELLAG